MWSYESDTQRETVNPICESKCQRFGLLTTTFNLYIIMIEIYDVILVFIRTEHNTHYLLGFISTGEILNEKEKYYTHWNLLMHCNFKIRFCLRVAVPLFPIYFLFLPWRKIAKGCDFGVIQCVFFIESMQPIVINAKTETLKSFIITKCFAKHDTMAGWHECILSGLFFISRVKWLIECKHCNGNSSRKSTIQVDWLLLGIRSSNRYLIVWRMHEDENLLPICFCRYSICFVKKNNETCVDWAQKIRKDITHYLSLFT